MMKTDHCVLYGEVVDVKMPLYTLYMLVSVLESVFYTEVSFNACCTVTSLLFATKNRPLIPRSLERGIKAREGLAAVISIHEMQT